MSVGPKLHRLPPSCGVLNCTADDGDIAAVVINDGHLTFALCQNHFAEATRITADAAAERQMHTGTEEEEN